MKKRVFILCAALMILCCGCGKKPPAETLPVETLPETTEAVSTEPEVEYATAQVNGIPAVLEVLSRGDTVDLVGAFDEKHYIVKREIGYGLVEKNLVRPEQDPAYEAWTGYAYQNAAVFDNYRLAGNAVKKLPSDTKVDVLDDLGWCVLVKHEGKTGYMKPEGLAKTPRSNTGNSGSESTGEDGGDIWLQHSGNLMLLSAMAPQKGTVSGSAMVLADETQVILGYFDRGDKIPVLKQNTDPENLTIYLDGLYAQVSGTYVQTAGEKEKLSWEGRCKQIASVYDDFWMLGSPSDRLNTNTELTVLYELENCYLVEVNGTMGYMKKADVELLTVNIPKETVPAATTPATNSTAPTETVPAQDSSDAQNPTEESNPAASTPTESQPTQPQPTQPQPTQPQPTQPQPTQPQPTEPKPTEPVPTEPEPTETTTPTQGTTDDEPEAEKPTTDPEWTPPIL